MKHIKDPIHGYIDVPDPELSMINSLNFQRLRRIKQLGMSSTVYPSATHTRFAHSLGVMYLAHELGKSIDMSDEQIRENQIAGLLHDSGHLPFSHTFESMFESETGYSHEDLSCNLVDDLASDENVEFPVSTDRIKNIIRGGYSGVNLIKNEIDCDRLDYLLRDSYHTGIELGSIEHDTLIKFAKVIDGELGFNHKALKSVERLIDARMQMAHSVYSHDTVDLTETMIRRAVRLHVKNTEDKMMDFIGMNDCSLGSILSSSAYEPTSDLYHSVKNRRLYKKSYYDPLDSATPERIENIYSNLTQKVEDHEKRLAEIAGVDRHEVIISPVSYAHIEDYTTPIQTTTGSIKMLENVSAKPESLREDMRMRQNISVYTKPDNVELLSDYAEDYISSL